jgi:hypothetical protein
MTSIANDDSSLPQWYVLNGKSTENLPVLLGLASDSYGRHTEWYLRHRDTTLKQLAVLLTAELVAANFFYISSASRLLVLPTLIFLIILSPVLAFAGAKSCHQAFQAAMENVLLINKIVWAMGLGGKVHIDSAYEEEIKIPVPKDRPFYVPRYLKDSSKFDTTEQFTAFQLGELKNQHPKNTYFWALVTIWTLGCAGIVTGVSCLFAIWLHKAGG